MIFKKLSLSEWIFYIPLYSLFTLMVRIRISNQWIKNVAIMRHIKTFRITFVPSEQKWFLFTKESSLHFQSFYFKIWSQRIQLVRYENMILRYQFFSQKVFLMDLSLMHRMFGFHWIFTYEFWLYSYHSFSTVSIFLKNLWPSIEW